MDIMVMIFAPLVMVDFLELIAAGDVLASMALVMRGSAVMELALAPVALVITTAAIVIPLAPVSMVFASIKLIMTLTLDNVHLVPLVGLDPIVTMPAPVNTGSVIMDYTGVVVARVLVIPVIMDTIVRSPVVVSTGLA